MRPLVYNIDFLIGSLVFLLVILFHFRQQRNMDISNNVTFLWLIGLGILNICFDILCTVLITLSSPRYAVLTELCLVLLYCLQILVPNALLSHVFRQFSHKVIGSSLRIFFCAVLPAVIVIGIFCNHWTGMFFTVSPDGSYSRGPWYLVMYAIAAAYLVGTLITVQLHRKHMFRYKRRAVWEMVILAGITVCFQIVHHDVLLSGFGIALGITVLFLTLNNPFQYTDSVTSVFDIRYFRDRCQSHMDHRRNFHVLAVELTQLKRLNRVLGTGVGNQLLEKTAQMLLSGDKKNLVFRISGRRLAVLTSSVIEYDRMRSRIMEFFRNTIELSGQKWKVPVVVCGILNAEQLESSDGLLEYIMYLLSLAPRSADPQLIQGDDDSLRGFYNQKTIENYLSTAIEQDLFTVAYQPIYSVKEHRFTSCEALSRLTHPDLGPVSPDIFIHLAEKDDKIAQLSLMQLRRVCRFIKENPVILEKLDSMKFNLSPAELMRTGHADQLIRVIEESGIPAGFIQFEITETVATEYSHTLMAVAEKFGKKGIRLCLDDFGSGFANLNTVFRMPFSVIKLDRSLLFDICRDERAASLYRGLISSMHIMNFTVLAEGVETKEESDLVSGCGVDMIQGFYYSHPVSGEQLLQTI